MGENIYKYATLSSAIKIIESKKILLNNPKIFNDPFDCVFFTDFSNERKIKNLVYNYCAYKFIHKLISEKKISLNNELKRQFERIRRKFNKNKEMMRETLYYDEVPELIAFILIIKKNKKIRKDLTDAYKNFKNKLDEITEEMKSIALVSCFSKRNDSILMWSHYANNHKGVCLEFERPIDNEFKNVVYTNNRPKINYYDCIASYLAHDILKKEIDVDNFKYTDDLLKPFYTKSLDWEYEQEVRCVFSKTNIQKYSRLSFDGENYFVDVGKIKKYTLV